MRTSKRISALLSAALIVLTVLPTSTAAVKKPKPKANDDGMNMFDKSDFIEKEQPELTEETKQLISLYKRKPTEENYLNLRAEVIKNYDAVLVRKEAKLAELKEETAGKPGGEAKVAEMEEIVQEMYETYWNRINSSMLRFTDPRLLNWKVANAYQYDYIPVMGAGTTVYVGRTQVTNAQYAVFISETGYPAPSNWTDGAYPAGEDDFPVNDVSAEDAEAWAARGEKVVLVRLETSPEDITGMKAAQGILTVRGGMTSHAAVVARGMGKCCVSGCGDIKMDEENKQFELAGKVYHEGDWLSIDGSTGNIYDGLIPTVPASVDSCFSYSCWMT